MRESLRKLLRLAALCSAGLSVIVWVICTYLTDGSRWLGGLWKLSASAGLAAYVLEFVCRRFDKADANKLRDELDAANKIIKKTANRHVPVNVNWNGGDNWVSMTQPVSYTYDVCLADSGEKIMTAAAPQRRLQGSCRVVGPAMTGVASYNNDAGTWILDEVHEVPSSIVFQQGPRQISDKAIAILKNSLSKYPGQKFLMLCRRDNPEGLSFAKDIREFLISKCEWKSETAFNVTGIGEIYTPDFLPVGQGICVVADGTDVQEERRNGRVTTQVCEDFLNGLESAGIPTFPLGAMSHGSLNPGVLGIIIGVK